MDEAIIAFLKDQIIPSDKEEAQKLKRRASHFVFQDGILYKKGFFHAFFFDAWAVKKLIMCSKRYMKECVTITLEVVLSTKGAKAGLLLIDLEKRCPNICKNVR